MNAAARIRELTRDDLAFAHALRGQVGWNQTYADWERFLACQPDGCFIAEAGGRPVGTATTTIYGPELAWIGMVLVDPAHRRCGFGRALLLHCLSFLEQRGVTGIKLDATPAGKQVYDALGFVDEWTLTRWRRPATEGLVSQASPAGALTTVPCRTVPLTAPFDARLAALDREAFGIDRTAVRERLHQQSAGVAVLGANLSTDELGYGLRRPGANATYLGPLVASTPTPALAIAEHLLQDLAGPVIWDIPDAQAEARDFASARGFVPERRLTRMVRGTNTCPGRPAMIFGLAGPEIG